MHKIYWKILILLIFFGALGAHGDRLAAQDGSDYDSWLSDSWNDDATSSGSSYDSPYDNTNYDDRYSTPPPVKDEIAKPVENPNSDNSTLFDSWSQPNSSSNAQPGSSSGAFSNYDSNAPESAAPSKPTTPPSAGGTVSTSAAPTPPPGATPDSNYSGYYKVGNDLYFYDQELGSFEIAVKGKDPESAPGTDGAYPGFSSSPSLSSRGYDANAAKIGFVDSRNRNLAECSRWQHPLTKQSLFSTEATCEQDLEKALESARKNIDIEQELYADSMPSALVMPRVSRLATEIRHPKLEKAIEQMSSRGCLCIRG